MTTEYTHQPVLLTEILEALQPRPGATYIDATVGGGGHAEKVMDMSQPNGRLLALDADPIALTAARRTLERFGDDVTYVEAYSDALGAAARAHGFRSVNGVMYDLGVSSPQIDRPDRGFSFSSDAPLDMRFGPGAGDSASDLVNRLSEAELRRIIGEYGDERYAGRIARHIAEERGRRAILTTGQLSAIVMRAKPFSRSEKIHPATRVFQALRIAVNDELGRLSRSLPQAVEALAHGGRLAVISFHSLEDRIVKQFFRQEERGCICPPDFPTCVCGRTQTLRIVTKRPITAGPAEVAHNPRARSAKLRVAERTDHTT